MLYRASLIAILTGSSVLSGCGKQSPTTEISPGSSSAGASAVGSGQGTGGNTGGFAPMSTGGTAPGTTGGGGGTTPSNLGGAGGAITNTPEVVLAKPISCTPYQAVEQTPDLPTAAACESYEFYDSPTVQARRAEGLGLAHIQSGPLALAWGEGRDQISVAHGAVLDALENDPATQAQARRNLDELRQRTVEQQKVSLIPNLSPIDGSCYTTTFYIANTDYVTGSQSGAAGANCDRAAGTREVGHLAMFSTTANAMAQPEVTLDQIMAHEYMHTLQCRVNRPQAPGWTWTVESFANYFGNAVANKTTALNHWQENRHWAVDGFLHRYGVWPFWQFLEHHSCLGPEFTAAVWQRQVDGEESALQFLRRIAPFDCPAGDEDCRDEAWGNLYGEFAVAATTYLPFKQATTIDYWQEAQKATDRLRRWYASTEHVSENRYRSVDSLAPQRLGFNVVRLIRDPAQSTVSVDFRGWPVPERGAEWRVALLAIDSEEPSPNVVAKTELWKSGRQTVDLTAWENDLGGPIESLLLVVAATPTAPLSEGELSEFNSSERYRELDRYAYDFTVEGAWPSGHEPSTQRPLPDEAGAAHPNGGGFVAQTASVDASAWVGPEARVLGEAQVLDQSRVRGRAVVRGQAIVSGNAIVSGTALVEATATVGDRASVRDNAHIFGQVKLSDEAVVAGEALVQGSFSMSGQSRLFGAPLTENQRDNTLQGTAIYDGSRWQRQQTLSAGTDYNDWSDADPGLLARYDFEQAHAYRVRDRHSSHDAYCVSSVGGPSSSSCVAPARVGESNVWDGAGEHSLRLPSLLLDLPRMQFKARIYWTAPATGSRCLFGATTEQNELLEFALRTSDAGAAELVLLARDAAGNSSELVLSDFGDRAGSWQQLDLKMDETTGAVTISLVEPGNPAAQALGVLPVSLRTLDHDSLEFHLGRCPSDPDSAWLGQIDDVTFHRTTE